MDDFGKKKKYIDLHLKFLIFEQKENTFYFYFNPCFIM
jgi:hypothetical protein